MKFIYDRTKCVISENNDDGNVLISLASQSSLPSLSFATCFSLKTCAFQEYPLPPPSPCSSDTPDVEQFFFFFSSGASPQERGPQKKSFQCFSQITVVKYNSASHQCVIYNDLVEG